MDMNKIRYYIETYGCQMNVADSELVSGILKQAGYEQAESLDDADIIIFNTCSVRQHAEDRVIGRISNEISRKAKKPGLKIGVIGCVAQRLSGELKKINKKIDFVVGVDQYKHLPRIINLLDFYGVNVATDVNNSEVYHNMMPVRQGDLNAFVTIMRGCDNFCTYCIVPHVRGRERSRPLDEILKEVEEAGNDGFKDVTLLGQNVNSYNWKELDFPQLLEQVDSLETIKRVRFVTSHPKDLSDSLVKYMAKLDKVCEHIHLPMQSGNTDILTRMNRGYTSEHYMGLIKKLKAAMPDISITTDVIVGFPGETEEQFMDTYNMMKEIEFDFAFMFKYSPREGTAAAEYEDQVDEKVRLERLSRLIDMQNEITNKKYKEQIGKIKEIYVEQVSKKNPEELAGKSRDFKITVFKADKSLIGKFVKVKITEATGWTLKGELIEEID